MARAFVTGGTGFVGANLVRRLLGDGHEVHIAVRPQHRSWRLDDVLHQIHVHTVDVVDVDLFREAVAGARPDWVFHLAAYGAYPQQRGIRAMVDTNVVGTTNVVEAALGASASLVVNTGSSSEYGYTATAPSEDAAPDPNSDYAVTKVAGTLYCRHVARDKDANVVTLRLYSVFGPYEEPGRLLPTVVVRGLEGRLPPLVNPATARDFVHVDDVVDAYLLLTARPDLPRGSIFNVGTGQQRTLADVAEVARRVFAIEQEPEWGAYPARAWDTDVWVADPSALQSLGWKPAVDFAEGVARMASWMEAEPDRLQFYRAATSPS